MLTVLGLAAVYAVAYYHGKNAERVNLRIQLFVLQVIARVRG